MRSSALGVCLALSAFVVVPLEAAAATCPKGVAKPGCPAPAGAAAAAKPTYVEPRTISPDASYGAPFDLKPFGYSAAPVFRPPYQPYGGGPYGYALPY
jgi:hypothetical protein